MKTLNQVYEDIVKKYKTPPTETELAKIRDRYEGHTGHHEITKLLAAIAERDHLLYIIAQDSNQYQQGLEDGIRLGREQAAQVANAVHNETSPYEQITDEVLKEVTSKYGPTHNHLPPERLREYVEQLRAVLSRIEDCSPVTQVELSKVLGN